MTTGGPGASAGERDAAGPVATGEAGGLVTAGEAGGLVTSGEAAGLVTTSDPGAQRRVLNRLRRAHGQLAAVIRAVEDGKPCRDVITQLAATSKALDRAGIVLISSAMQECLSAPEGAGPEGGLTPSDLEELFLMLA